MPTPLEIRRWKQQYGKIFSVSIAGVDYIFRELTFAEYDEVVALELDEDSAEAEDHLISLVLLHPSIEQFDQMPAGVITSLAEEVLELSGFGSPRYAKQLLEVCREEVSEVRGLMKAFVLATMPAYKEEELDQLTFAELAMKVALSEQIIKINQTAFGIEIDIKLDLIDPEEEAQKQEEELRKHAAQKKPGQAGYNDPIAQKLAQALG